MGRIVLVSNRLPVTVERQESGLAVKPSIGGLATGVSSLFPREGRMWIGWPGLPSDELDEGELRGVAQTLQDKHQCRPVFLSREELRQYYHGFCNDTLWPLFHYFLAYVRYEDSFWEAYRQINQRFCSAVLEILQPGDSLWIHDYHLLLLPELVHRERPEVPIGFFLHIPFPSFEIFRMLPWRKRLLQGMLGAALVGFHTYDYVRHFVTSVRSLLGAEHTFGRIRYEGRTVLADVFPMGIDYERFSKSLRRWAVRKEFRGIARLRDERKTILSVDRLDYTKGIPQRLQAFERFLEANPGYQRRVKMILIVAPSRTQVHKYRELLREVNVLVSSINGRFGTPDWVPVLYFYRSFPFEKLTPLYAIADVLLVTPLRDGMNLIAKEYIATRSDRKGVLILSETAGAAQELGESLIVNSNSTEEVAAAMKTALELRPSERRRRNALMSHRLKRYNVSAWAKDFLDKLRAVHALNRRPQTRRMTPEGRDLLLREYLRAKSRLLLLDYDGSLVALASRPEKALPDKELRRMLSELAEVPGNEVVLISGRDRSDLSRWFGELAVNLVAEHGVWQRPRGRDWKLQAGRQTEWKESIRPLLELHADRTPGALVEEKEHSLAWHYRRADPELAEYRLRELKEALRELIANLDLSIMEGSRVLEVKQASSTKGHAAAAWLAQKRWDFLLAVGDDRTDEEMFAVLPPDAYSLKVGDEPSRARFALASVTEVRQLIKDLLLCRQISG
jgi:trehalose 6-phosphate synthase/phosphatase